MTLPFVMSGGHRRFLACLPPRADFGGFPKFRARAVPVVPRAQWKPIDRRWLFPAGEFILDQDGIGSCVANGSAAALRKARYISGMGQGDIPLSPGALYAQINGGSDNGAVISDALTALQQTGTCRYGLVGETPFYLNQLPAGWKDDARHFRISQAYHCQSFDEIGSALQLGFIVVYGIQVGSNFESFDRYGVAGHSSGPGNHCMHADGMTQLADGRWVIDNANSWGATWGPSADGRCYLCEDHFLHGDQPDAFAIQSAVYDPTTDPNLPKAS
jgi:hypothetical protein